MINMAITTCVSNAEKVEIALGIFLYQHDLKNLV